LIEEHSQVLAAADVPSLLAELQPDALELHCQAGRLQSFAQRLAQLSASGVCLQRVAVSMAPAAGEPPAAMAAELWGRFALLRAAGFKPLWQLDGKPMSGDLGLAPAREAVRLLAALASLAPPGPLQLAGGTNAQTLLELDLQNLRPRAAGVAFGGEARRRLQPWLLQAQQRSLRLLDCGDLWPDALVQVKALVDPWLASGPLPIRGC
jgi:hypothetical protein